MPYIKKKTKEGLQGFLVLVGIALIINNYELILGLAFFLIAIYVSGKLISWSIKTHNNRRKQKRIIESGIKRIDNLTGYEFEEFLEAFFKELGYNVLERTSKSGDFGADLIINDNTNNKIAVQAKRYSNKVSPRAVQEVSGALGYYGCDKGLIVTNSYLTSSAKELAKRNRIECWEREELINKLSRLNSQD